jgi:holo-[acyl-carrier protein] synthase
MASGLKPASPKSNGPRRQATAHDGTYAKRFAAKAFSKAVGTGFYRGDLYEDIGVVKPSGASLEMGRQAACATFDAGRP